MFSKILVIEINIRINFFCIFILYIVIELVESFFWLVFLVREVRGFFLVFLRKFFIVN